MESSFNLLKFDIFTSGSSHYILEMGYPKDVRQTERIYQKGLTTKKFPKEEAFPKAWNCLEVGKTPSEIYFLEDGLGRHVPKLKKFVRFNSCSWKIN